MKSAVQKSDGFSSLALPKRIVMKAPWQSILIRFVK